MKFVIVDGLSKTRMYYKDKIESIISKAEVIECISAEDALFTVHDKKPDIIISSEILPNRNGFDLVRLLKKIKIRIPVIIIANDDNNAIDAIKTNVFDFIVHPFEEEKLVQSIYKAIDFIDDQIKMKLTKKFEKNIRIRMSTSSGYKWIDLDNLTYCLAEGAYTKIFFSNAKMDYSSYNLGKIEKVLVNYHFVRISRSVIVNLKQILKIDQSKEICYIECNDEVLKFKISKSNLKRLEVENIL